MIHININNKQLTHKISPSHVPLQHLPQASSQSNKYELTYPQKSAIIANKPYNSYSENFGHMVGQGADNMGVDGGVDMGVSRSIKTQIANSRLKYTDKGSKNKLQSIYNKDKANKKNKRECSQNQKHSSVSRSRSRSGSRSSVQSHCQAGCLRKSDLSTKNNSTQANQQHTKNIKNRQEKQQKLASIQQKLYNAIQMFYNNLSNLSLDTLVNNRNINTTDISCNANMGNDKSANVVNTNTGTIASNLNTESMRTWLNQQQQTCTQLERKLNKIVNAKLQIKAENRRGNHKRDNREKKENDCDLVNVNHIVNNSTKPNNNSNSINKHKPNNKNRNKISQQSPTTTPSTSFSHEHLYYQTKLSTVRSKLHNIKTNMDILSNMNRQIPIDYDYFSTNSNSTVGLEDVGQCNGSSDIYCKSSNCNDKYNNNMINNINSDMDNNRDTTPTSMHMSYSQDPNKQVDMDNKKTRHHSRTHNNHNNHNQNQMDMNKNKTRYYIADRQQLYNSTNLHNSDTTIQHNPTNINNKIQQYKKQQSLYQIQMMSMNNQDNSACVTSNNTSAYNNNVFSLSNSNVNPINLGSNSNIIGASNNGNRQDYSIMDASSSCSYSADGSGLGHLSDTHKEMVQKFYNNIKMITNNNSTPATNNHIPTQTNKPNNPVTRTNPTQNNNSNTNYKIQKIQQFLHELTCRTQQSPNPKIPPTSKPKPKCESQPQDPNHPNQPSYQQLSASSEYEQTRRISTNNNNNNSSKHKPTPKVQPIMTQPMNNLINKLKAVVQENNQNQHQNHQFNSYQYQEMHTVKINDKHHPYIHNSRSISKDKQPHQQQYTSLKNPQQQSQHPQHPNQLSQLKPLLTQLHELKQQLLRKNSQIEHLLQTQQQHQQIIELYKTKQKQDKQALNYNLERIANLQSNIQRLQKQKKQFQDIDREMRQTIMNNSVTINQLYGEIQKLGTKLSEEVELNCTLKEQKGLYMKVMEEQIRKFKKSEKIAINKMEIYKQKYFQLIHEQELKKMLAQNNRNYSSAVVNNNSNGNNNNYNNTKPKNMKVQQIWGILQQHKNQIANLHQLSPQPDEQAQTDNIFHH